MKSSPPALGAGAGAVGRLAHCSRPAAARPPPANTLAAARRAAAAADAVAARANAAASPGSRSTSMQDRAFREAAAPRAEQPPRRARRSRRPAGRRPPRRGRRDGGPDGAPHDDRRERTVTYFHRAICRGPAAATPTSLLPRQNMFLEVLRGHVRRDVLSALTAVMFPRDYESHSAAPSHLIGGPAPKTPCIAPRTAARVALPLLGAPTLTSHATPR